MRKSIFDLNVVLYKHCPFTTYSDWSLIEKVGVPR